MPPRPSRRAMMCISPAPLCPGGVLEYLPGRIEGRQRIEAHRADRRLDQPGLARALGPARLREEMPARGDQGGEGNEADDLASRDEESELLRLFPRRLEHEVEGGGPVVEEIDRDLGAAVRVDVPAYGAHLPESARRPDRLAARVPQGFAGAVPCRPPRFAYAARDLLGQAPVARVQVDVIRNQHFARSDGGGAPARHEGGRTEVGRPLGSGELCRQALVLSRADARQAPALGLRGRLAVEVDGHAQLAGEVPAEASGQLDAGPHADLRYGHEGADVEGSHPRVGAGMPGHVDEAKRGLGRGEGGPGRGFGTADEGIYSSIRVRARIDVQE